MVQPFMAVPFILYDTIIPVLNFYSKALILQINR